jgi:hypothetical protein
MKKITTEAYFLILKGRIFRLCPIFWPIGLGLGVLLSKKPDPSLLIHL